MKNRVVSFVLVGAVGGAAALAIAPTGRASTASVPEPAVSRVTPPSGSAGAGLDLFGGGLPPGHPSVGRSGSPHGTPAIGNDEQAAIGWKMPPGWQTAPNPNAMRIATYRVTRSKGDPDDGEVSVARAGGTKDANIQRWASQFDGAAEQTREDRTVHGLAVTVVSFSGTYSGSSMTPGAAPTSRTGWAFLGAIVETPGSPYFFKLVGPVATVRAARASFDALIASITPN